MGAGFAGFQKFEQFSEGMDGLHKPVGCPEVKRPARPFHPVNEARLEVLLVRAVEQGFRASVPLCFCVA